METKTIHVKLFITGHTSRSMAAIFNIRKICEAEFGNTYKLDIIDVLEHPEIAEQEKIIATPTLIKSLPPPLRRLIGDLSEREKVLQHLEIITGDYKN